MKEFFKRLIKKIDQILCPKHYTCNLCGKEIFDDGDFCEECYKNLPFNDGNICINCGRATTIPTKRCYSCNFDWAVDRARSLFLYRDGGEKLIKSLKYGRRKYLAEILAPYLKQVYVKNLFTPDVITAIPMTKKKQRKRGFNQSELLAKNLSSLVDCKYLPLLKKVKETEEQKSLDFGERQLNLQSCYKVIDKNLVKGKRILIIDDVLTTGATAHAAAVRLKKAGAKSVYLLTVTSVQKQIAW